MQNDWPTFLSGVSSRMKEMRNEHPEVMKGFSALAQAALKPQALDAKTKELIALGISVAVRCDDCIGFHVKAALGHGATRAEIMETLGMANYMGAGPSAMYASHVLDAYEQMAKPQS